jgi:putative nucleotidyltransferase with HDIG domain
VNSLAERPLVRNGHAPQASPPSRRAAAAVDHARETITESVLSRAFSTATPSLGAELAVGAFVDALSESFATGHWTPMATFAAGIAKRGAHARGIRDVLRIAPAAASEALRRAGVMLPKGFDPLDAQRLLGGVLQTLANAPDSAGPVEPIDLLIEDLVTKLDESDPATAEHSRAVSAWCARMARRAELDPAEAAYVARAGLIHDVGKTKTPPEILSAPRKLDDEEWIVMRNHVLEGARIIEQISGLRHFTPAVRWHHERCDGRGYPDRRPGTDIPFAVRIVSVADAFNAMIGRRPYRKPTSPLRALEELRRHQGTQFDPAVVRLMIDVVTKP